jgi:flavin-dependent dehydrogenase
MVSMSNRVDVLVIGGGPSGATAATLLAKRGFSVRLFERDRFPRFHIGESMIPFCYPVLERLGVLPKMQASRFTKKYGVQFINEDGKLSAPFRFSDYDDHPRSQTWQVVRSEFDEMMLNNARDNGVDVHEETRVLHVIFDGSKAIGARIKSADGTEQDVFAKVVVDASGQASVLLDRLGLREWDAVLKKAAIWSYWKGALREPGLDEGGTIVIQTQEKKGWFWYIPLQDDIVSVGVVAGNDYLFKNRPSKDLETIFWEEVERCSGVKPRIENATRVDDYRAQKEYSYKAKKAAGDGWVLIGDAFGFLDPLYSSGLLLALISGSMASDAIGDALEKNDPSESQLRLWEAPYVKALDRMKNLVYAFYDGLNFGRLVRKHPEKKHLITDILIGNLFDDEVDDLWPLIDELRVEEAAEMATA